MKRFLDSIKTRLQPYFDYPDDDVGSLHTAQAFLIAGAVTSVIAGIVGMIYAYLEKNKEAFRQGLAYLAFMMYVWFLIFWEMKEGLDKNKKS